MNKKISMLLVILSGIFWGTTSLFVKALAVHGLDSIQISCIRVISSAIFMSLFVLIKDKSLFKIKLKDLPLFIIIGSVSIFSTSICYFKTISVASVSVACVLMYTAPIFVLIFSVIFFKEKLTNKKIIAVILAVIGCTLVSGIVGSDSRISGTGLIFGLLSGILYASYSILGKLILKKYSPLTMTVYAFIFAALTALFIFDFNTAGSLVVQNTYLILLYPLTGICTSVLPYLLYSLGLKKLEPSIAAVLSSVEPLVATLVSIFILLEPFSLISGAGILIILISVIILN